jgi:hypothetical protein
MFKLSIVRKVTTDFHPASSAAEPIGRIRLAKADSGEGRHKAHHHFINLARVAEVEGQKVRLSANGAVAVTMEEEESGRHT